ncbi:sensor domain-containing diguanylate cyclase [Rhodoferax sp. UBA5149]|uniref:sensor domain-containing diguanylate cyclase n=1 Tax=Rhodoferax sp. UBA5149 TaxID=1947379 RepID=UPI0025DA625B|nr:diguanylate cyclase [Rhodoferax sp. UBA5149]
MKKHFSVSFKNTPLHLRLRLMVGLLVISLLGSLAVYWIQVEVSNTQLRQDILSMTDLQAQQLADAVARQTDDLIRGIDNGLQHIRHDYLDDPNSFVEAVNATLEGYPEGTLLNIAVLDALGDAVYNMVPARGQVYGGDRDYFRVQAASSVDRPYVGQAILGRISNVWVIPVSRKLVVDGRFAGVVTVFLRADYLQGKLARIARHKGDVISLFTLDGAYLSRSTDLDNSLGKSTPRDRPFLGPNAPRAGVFRVVAAFDKVPRIYGWSRLDDHPLVVVVGLDTKSILAPIEVQIEHGRQVSAIGSSMIVAGMLFVVGLLLHTSRQQRKISENEAALQISKAAFEAASEGMMVTDAENRILMVNPAFSQITGYTEQDVIGQRPSVLSSGHQDRDFYATLWRALNTHGHWEGEVTNRHKNGQLYIEWLKISVIDRDDPVRRRHVAVISDITVRKRGEEIVWRRANYDELTGLPNRRMFIDRLKQTLGRAARHGYCLAVLFIDLDEFKPVNDRYGHQTGDELLKQVASRMDLCLREEDTVARQGGDEFVVMLATVHSEREALAVAEKLLAALHGPFEIDGHMINIGASIGVALFPQHGETADILVEKADAAMYTAKGAGRHAVRLYSAELPVSGREDA